MYGILTRIPTFETLRVVHSFYCQPLYLRELITVEGTGPYPSEAPWLEVIIAEQTRTMKGTYPIGKVWLKFS